LLIGFLRRIAGGRFGFSVIDGVATNAFRASSNDNGARETGRDFLAFGSPLLFMRDDLAATPAAIGEGGSIARQFQCRRYREAA